MPTFIRKISEEKLVSSAHPENFIFPTLVHLATGQNAMRQPRIRAAVQGSANPFPARFQIRVRQKIFPYADQRLSREFPQQSPVTGETKPVLEDHFAAGERFLDEIGLVRVQEITLADQTLRDRTIRLKRPKPLGQGQHQVIVRIVFVHDGSLV